MNTVIYTQEKKQVVGLAQATIPMSYGTHSK